MTSTRPVHSNANQTDTFMNMGQAGGGFDFGVKQYREVLVFKDAKTLDTFVNKGREAWRSMRS